MNTPQKTEGTLTLFTKERLKSRKKAMWLNAGPSFPIIVFFAVLVDLILN